MTGGRLSSTADVDFFSLHNRKEKRIDVEMLDYAYVAKCTDVDELKGILAMLRSGKEGRYPHLEKTAEDRILTLLPERERQRIVRMRAEPSHQELSAENAELLSWSEHMDAKHKALREHKSGNRRLPPVRGRPVGDDVPSKKQTAAALIEELPQQEPKQKQAIPAYDFRAWEKYDVDQALEDIDAQEEQRKEQARAQREAHVRREKERKKELASLPSYVDFDELSREEKDVYALHEKQKGNECFKANENDEAILYYTRSMAFDDTNAIVYANRAMAHLRAKSFAAAEQDCTRAVLLDPTYMKGWSRRGMTRFRRGKYAEAIADFEEALRLEPANKELEKLLKKAQDKWKEVDGTVQFSTNSDSSNQNSNDQFAPVAQSTSVTGVALTEESPSPQEETHSKPFKRFEIIEDSDAESDEDDDPPSAHHRKQNQQQQDTNGVEEEEDEVEKPFQRFEILED